jgi:hypothetical protein
MQCNTANAKDTQVHRACCKGCWTSYMSNCEFHWGSSVIQFQRRERRIEDILFRLLVVILDMLDNISVVGTPVWDKVVWYHTQERTEPQATNTLPQGGGCQMQNRRWVQKAIRLLCICIFREILRIQYSSRKYGEKSKKLALWYWAFFGNLSYLTVLFRACCLKLVSRDCNLCTSRVHPRLLTPKISII